MKKLIIFLLLLTLVFAFAGCNNEQPKTDIVTPDAETEPIQTQPTTNDPFEFESEIDFSDFETVAPNSTENTESQPTETENPSQPEPTNPAPTEPDSTEPDSTEPEETQTPTTASPSLGPDGYNNQIVRP